MGNLLKSLFATMGLLLVALLGTTAAQENLPFGPSNYDQDFQLFAPFQLDLDNMSEDQWSGYFFEYNKLVWSYSGERVTVGSDDPSAARFAETIFYPNPTLPATPAPAPNQYSPNQGTPPPPHVIRNTLRDVPPKAGFALGNRYELGYRDHDHGWLIGVLDGPQLNQTEFYGFRRVDTNGDGIPDGLPPFIEPDYTDGSDIGPGTGPVNPIRAFGFGSVPVLFELSDGFRLTGFRDYLNRLDWAQVGTQGGPFLYVGNYGGLPEDTQGFRFADDIDQDGIEGSFVLLDVNGNVLAVITDFGDLHEFNVYFDNVTIHNRSFTDGIEVMWSHQLTNQHYMAKHQNNRLSVSWGARFLKLYDEFDVNAEGSILHDATWTTVFTNQIVGPQVAFSWVNQRQRWRLSTEGRFLFGYNVADWDQYGLMGFGLIPGGLNQPLYARPTAFSYGLREQEFSPVGELRVQASYHIFEQMALKIGYTGSYLGNIRRAAPSVHYQLPAMGYKDTGGEDFLINGFDFGVEFVY